MPDARKWALIKRTICQNNGILTRAHTRTKTHKTAMKASTFSQPNIKWIIITIIKIIHISYKIYIKKDRPSLIYNYRKDLSNIIFPQICNFWHIKVGLINSTYICLLIQSLTSVIGCFRLISPLVPSQRSVTNGALRSGELTKLLDAILQSVLQQCKALTSFQHCTLTTTVLRYFLI